ncbi:ras-related protein Rab-39B isoform X1 [Cygnus olor]|uniref:ras-related protein Rab-39B isoform X2 n=1 Tax=Cygnus atratus TaxID=8868 RepID=UPI0015D5C2A7|nr:ras-related protein Rab-39B isoform X2 [Cygnus atratus]XP_040428456.1 ras-related protein Rab-39B isoform X1 [Cygnus olor]
MEAIWLYQFRLIVIGDSTVGKSCLIRRFTEGRFAQISDPTVGVDFFSRLVEIEPGKRIKLQIWDTAGQERFRSITRAYYRNSVGGLLLFDITNRRSFQNVHEWLEETKVHVQPYQIVFVLVGHKCDLDTQRQVTRHEAEKLAAAYGKQSWRRLMQSTTGAWLPWALYLQLLLTPVESARFAQTGTVSPVFTKARTNTYERVSSFILFFQGLAIHKVCPGLPS